MVAVATVVVAVVAVVVVVSAEVGFVMCTC